MSDSLRSLRGNEQCEQIAHFWTKNERFARKSNERIPSPAKILLNWPFITKLEIPHTICEMIQKQM